MAVGRLLDPLKLSHESIIETPKYQFTWMPHLSKLCQAGEILGKLFQGDRFRHAQRTPAVSGERRHQVARVKYQFKATLRPKETGDAG